MPVSQKVMIIELCRRRQCIANSNATFADVQVGEVMAKIGPLIQELRVYGYGEDFGSGFEYRLIGEYSNDGLNWSSFSGGALFDETGTGNKIGAAYSTTADFGMDIRFKLSTKATTAGTGGTVTMFLAITFKS